MLNVSVLDSQSQRTLVVEGGLTAPWASELESVWKQTVEPGADRKVVVDLGFDTLIDETGNALLSAMVADGAGLVGRGLYREYLVKAWWIGASPVNESRDVLKGLAFLV